MFLWISVSIITIAATAAAANISDHEHVYDTCNQYQDCATCLQTHIGNNSNLTHSNNTTYSACIWCEASTGNMSFCVNVSSFSNSFNLSSIDHLYTCYGDSYNYNYSFNNNNYNYHSSCNISNTSSTRDPAWLKKWLTQFAEDKSTVLKVFMDLLILPPAMMINLVVVYFFCICVFSLCLGNRFSKDKTCDYLHLTLVLSIIICLIPFLLLCAVGLVICKLCKISTILYCNVTKFLVYYKNDYKPKNTEWSRWCCIDSSGKCNCYKYTDKKSICQHFGLLISYWILCSCVAFFSFSCYFVSIIHGGIPFMDFFANMWMYIFIAGVGIGAGVMFIGCSCLIIWNCCCPGLICLLTRDFHDFKKNIIDKWDDTVEMTWFWLFVFGMEIIFIVIILLIANFGVFVFTVLYLIIIVNGAVFIYVVIPDMIYDWYKLKQEKEVIESDEIPPFITNVQVILTAPLLVLQFCD